MDRVFIKGLRIETVIGVYAWEQAMRQLVVLDVEMAWDNRPAALADDITLALDYAAVSQRLQAFVGGQAFLLVEKLAEDVAALLLREFSMPWVGVRVTKPRAVQEADGVGVYIERGAC